MTGRIKVFVAWTQEYEDAGIVGVYRTLEEAQDACQFAAHPRAKKAKLRWTDGGFAAYHNGEWKIDCFVLEPATAGATPDQGMQ